MDPTIEALSYLALALDLIVGFYLVYIKLRQGIHILIYTI